MKSHRIFIAVNLPAPIKKKLLEFQRQWADLPVRWTKEPSLHITLVFIGYVDNEEMLEICQLARQAVKENQLFEIKLKRICLGPPGRPARLIWIEGEENLALTQLKNNLEEALLNSTTSSYNHQETRHFRVHITLARIRQEEWRCLPNKPKIDQEVSLSFPVESIEVMESRLLKDGAEYIILESIPLEASFGEDIPDETVSSEVEEVPVVEKPAVIEKIVE